MHNVTTMEKAKITKNKFKRKSQKNFGQVYSRWKPTQSIDFRNSRYPSFAFQRREKL
jgi:hypothetical protein